MRRLPDDSSRLVSAGFAGHFPLGCVWRPLNNPDMTMLIDLLAAELERHREISAQVLKHLVGAHGVAREEIGTFLVAEMPKLEDYEIDLILAPLFTPSLVNQAVCAAVLGRNSVGSNQWPGLIRQLVARPTRAQLIAEDGTTHSVQLREVTVERFVHRLRLEGTMIEAVFELILRLAPAGDRALLLAVARRATWEHSGRCEILTRCLAAADDARRRVDAVALLRLVETYEPTSVADLLARIPHWQQVLRQSINAGGAKPFFNERVEELHGGGRDQRRHDNRHVTAKEQEQDFLAHLSRVLSNS
jgi:hypothetical protein